MLKVIELFAGVGSQTQALKNIGVEHKVIGISEIDKYAISSYTQLHGEVHNFGDISNIEKLPGADLWTYSFPCQDLSVAGKGAGIKQGTRSGLLLEVERLLEVSEKPKYLLMENVKNLVGKKNKADFDRWCNKLEELGYTNYWEVLNAKDYGIPQNRERVFMISILGEHKPYTFPVKEELKLRLKDMLEKEVDEKFYLKKELVERFTKFPSNRLSNEIEIVGTTAPNPYNKKGELIFDKCTSAWVLNPDKLCSTLSAREYKQPKQIIEANRIGGVFDTENSTHQAGSVWDKEGLAPTLDTMQGGYRQPLIEVVGEITPNSQAGKVYSRDGISPTFCSGTHGYAQGYVDTDDFKIRKLTPKECWRLMGWKDQEFDKIKGISNTQLYKQAGNGIVVTVLEKIFGELFSYEIAMKEHAEEYQKQIEIELKDYVLNREKYEKLAYYDNED